MMRSLLRLNLQLMWTYLLFLLVWVVLFSFFHIQNQIISSTFLAVLLALYVGLPESLLTLEQNCHWDRYMLTMPVSRKTVVQSKYFFMILSAIIISVWGMLVNTILYGKEQIPVYLFLLEVCCICAGLILPFYLKRRSPGKSVMAVFTLVLVCGAAGGFLSLQELWFAYSVCILGFLAIIALIVLIVSYQISLRIYSKKEF